MTNATRHKNVVIVCKLCGCRVERYPDSLYWHCEGVDMSHRGLIPADVVKEAVVESFETKKYRKKGEVRRVVG